MAEDNIPPPTHGFRPPPWAFGDQNYYAPPAPPAENGELKRLRAENERLRAAQQAPQQVDDVESRLRAEYQDVIAQSMSRIKKLRTQIKEMRGERDAAVAECDALRKRNAALESAAAATSFSDSFLASFVAWNWIVASSIFLLVGRGAVLARRRLHRASGFRHGDGGAARGQAGPGGDRPDTERTRRVKKKGSFIY